MGGCWRAAHFAFESSLAIGRADVLSRRGSGQLPSPFLEFAVDGVSSEADYMEPIAEPLALPEEYGKP
jgi:hypothetical protein